MTCQEQLKLALEKEQILLECLNSYAEKWGKLKKFLKDTRNFRVLDYLEDADNSLYGLLKKSVELIEEKNK